MRPDFAKLWLEWLLLRDGIMFRLLHSSLEAV